MRVPRNVFRLLIILEAAVLAAVIAFSAVREGKDAVQTKRAAADAGSGKKEKKAEEDRGAFVSRKAEAEGTAPDEGGDMEKTEPAVFSEEVQAKLASMTLEEKVAQMFLITPEALTHSDEVEVAGESTQAAVVSYPVGGLVYSTGNFKDPDQTREMLAGVQGFSQERIGLGMFLAVQEPGGSGGSPLAEANGYGQQPSPAEIGAGGEQAAAAQAAGVIASYLAEEGFNLNLMPSAAVLPAEGEQDAGCYGTDAQGASTMAAEAISAFRAGGIHTAAGSFPGKRAAGSTEEEWKEWEEENLAVFQAAAGAGTDCIMLSNTACEGLTGDGTLPCSLSGRAAAYLRNEMGYTGIIMTGSLSEEAITGKYSAGEAAVEAVKSGADLLYCPANFEEAYQAVVDAVNSGGLTEEAIDQAAGHILTQKMGQ